MSNILRNICIGREQLAGLMPKFFPNVVEREHAELQLIQVKA